MMLTLYALACGTRECYAITAAYRTRADARAAGALDGWTFRLDTGWRCPAHPVERPQPARGVAA